MCGIAGILGPAESAASLEIVRSMTNALAHRGPDGKVEFLSTIMRDISERKREEVERIEWTNRYAAAVRASGQVLFDWNSYTNEMAYAGDTERMLGYTIEELFGAATATATATPRKAASPARGRKLGKVAPKYRNPENPKETWTGRGKQPRWLAAHTTKGRDLGEFVIPGAAKPTPAKVRPATKKRVVKKAKK